MAATAKTLLENQPDIFWGSYHDDPSYHFGISIDYRGDTLVMLAIYVMSDCDDNEEMFVTPDVLADCYTIEDLEKHDIVLSNLMDEDDMEPIGWYCAELSVFKRANLEAIKESSERLDGYLDAVIGILETNPDETRENAEAFEGVSFFDMQHELETIPTLIDEGKLAKPLPFEFRLVGDALLGWEHAEESDYR